jgi:ribonuclease BN (tRNA processing enzyme)
MPPNNKRPRPQKAHADRNADDQYHSLELIVAGCGAGATAVYDGAASSTFLVGARRRDGHDGTTTPCLIIDLGFGAQRAISALCHGSFPSHAPIYISHNHSDHSGELPVVAAVERAKRMKRSSGSGSGGAPLVVLAEAEVAQTLEAHRLHELRSTGLELKEFVDLRPIERATAVYPIPPTTTRAITAAASSAGAAGEEGEEDERHGGEGGPLLLPWELGISLVLSRHSERCFGFLLYARDRAQPRTMAAATTTKMTATTAANADSNNPTTNTNNPWRPILGFSGDSAADKCVYARLAGAPVVLVDARPTAASGGLSQHASVEQVRRAASDSGMLSSCRRVIIYGYGGEAERRAAEAELRAGAPPTRASVEVAAPGMVVELLSRGGGGGGDGGGRTLEDYVSSRRRGSSTPAHNSRPVL